MCGHASDVQSRAFRNRSRPQVELPAHSGGAHAQGGDSRTGDASQAVNHRASAMQGAKRLGFARIRRLAKFRPARRDPVSSRHRTTRSSSIRVAFQGRLNYFHPHDDCRLPYQPVSQQAAVLGVVGFRISHNGEHAPGTVIPKIPGVKSARSPAGLPKNGSTRRRVDLECVAGKARGRKKKGIRPDGHTPPGHTSERAIDYPCLVRLGLLTAGWPTAVPA